MIAVQTAVTRAIWANARDKVLPGSNLLGSLTGREHLPRHAIGLTVVELLGRDGRRLHVRGVDMLDGTPVLDIKPYLSSVPATTLRRGWLADAEERRNRG